MAGTARPVGAAAALGGVGARGGSGTRGQSRALGSPFASRFLSLGMVAGVWGKLFVLTVSRGDVGASASFHVDCESILSLDLSLPCFAFARGQVRTGSSADERARSAADAPYATGLALGTYLTSPAARSQPLLACFIFLWGQLK